MRYIVTSSAFGQAGVAFVLPLLVRGIPRFGDCTALSLACHRDPVFRTLMLRMFLH